VGGRRDETIMRKKEMYVRGGEMKILMAFVERMCSLKGHLLEIKKK
jgi:hypothetical protein